jgi:hypothetical protein
MSVACSTYGKEEKCVRTSEGKRVGNRPLGSVRRKWEYNYKIYLQGVERGDMDWINLA